MPGPVPGIHVFSATSKKVVDVRDKPGHDEERCTLVQRAARAFADAVARSRGIELRDLGLQMLVDEKQRLQRAADIAVASCDDRVDRRFTRPETHSKPLPIVPAG